MKEAKACLALLLAVVSLSSAEYRPRSPGPGHMRGPPQHHPPPHHKGYSSSAKLHHRHHPYHQNSYPGSSFTKESGSLNSRPLRYRKPAQGSSSGHQIGSIRPASWDSPSYKSPTKDRYKPSHFSSGEPPAGIIGGSSSFSSLSSGSLGPLTTFGFPSSGMDFQRLSDLSPIRTIPAPNLGPTSFPPTTHLGAGSLASQLASQSPAVFPSQLQHHTLDMSDASSSALASNKHALGYQVSEPSTLYAPDPDPSRTAPIIRPSVDSALQNDLALRIAPYSTMPHLASQSGFSTSLSALPTASYSSMPVASLSSQDLLYLLSGLPFQQDSHNFVRQGQNPVTETEKFNSQIHQAQLQQAAAQYQQQAAQFQQSQMHQQLAASNVNSDFRGHPQLRLSLSEHPQQLVLPGRRGQQQELEGSDSSPVLRLYHSMPANFGPHRLPINHHEEISDSDVDGSEQSAATHPIPPSPSPAPDTEDVDQFMGSTPMSMSDMAMSMGADNEGDFSNPAGSDGDDEEDPQQDTRPSRIRSRKNRDRL